MVNVKNFKIKKLSTYLFLILFSFSSPSFADDIQDFQIEGISLGDSLLDHYSKEEITNKIRKDAYSYSDKKYTDSIFKNDGAFINYDSLQIVFIRSDENFIIQGLGGTIWYGKNIDVCLNKMDQIVEELSTIFIGAKKVDQEIRKHPSDKSGKSTSQGVAFFLKDGGASVRCYHWSEKMNTQDYLQISIRSKKFNEWLRKWQ